MIQFLNAADKAAEARMVRTAFAGSILFTEGSSDALFFQKFVDESQCYLLVAHGKENAIGAVLALEADGIPGILAITDADHWHLLDRASPSDNMGQFRP